VPVFLLLAAIKSNSYKGQHWCFRVFHSLFGSINFFGPSIAGKHGSGTKSLGTNRNHKMWGYEKKGLELFIPSYSFPSITSLTVLARLRRRIDFISNMRTHGSGLIQRIESLCLFTVFSILLGGALFASRILLLLVDRTLTYPELALSDQSCGQTFPLLPFFFHLRALPL